MNTETTVSMKQPPIWGKSVQHCTYRSRPPLAPRPHLIDSEGHRSVSGSRKITATLTRSGKPTTIQVEKIKWRRGEDFYSPRRGGRKYYGIRLHWYFITYLLFRFDEHSYKCYFYLLPCAFSSEILESRSSKWLFPPNLIDLTSPPNST